MSDATQALTLATRMAGISQRLGRFCRPRLLWAGAFLLLALLVAPAYWKALHNPIAGSYHDDGIYLITAKALATGQGYRIISLPGPLAQTKYPPLYPWLLSLIWRVMPQFPQNLMALLSVSLLASIAWMFAAYLLARQENLPRVFAFLVVAISVTSVWTLGLSTMALSETTFAALCTGSILLLGRHDDNAGPRKSWVIFAGSLAGLAFLTRSMGIALVAAGVLWLLGKRRWRDALLFGVIACAIAAPWLVWGAMHHDPSNWVEAYYSARSYKINSILSPAFSMGQKVEVVGTNLFLLYLIPTWLLNIAPDSLWARVGVNAVWAVPFLFVAFKRFRLPAIFVLIYSGVLISVCGGQGARYFAPVFPLVTIVTLQAFPLNRRFVAVPLLAAAAVLVGHSLGSLYQAGNRSEEGHKAWASEGDQDPGELMRMISWLRTNTSSEARLSANIDPTFYLYTGRSAIKSSSPNFYELLYRWGAMERTPMGTLAGLREELLNRRIDYLVITADGDYMEAPYLHSIEDEIVRAHPSAFRLVYQGRTRDYRIFAVDHLKL